MLWRTQKPKLKHSPLVNVSEPWVSFTIPELTERNHVYKRTAIKAQRENHGSEPFQPKK